jgi:hypothetical protein
MQTAVGGSDTCLQPCLQQQLLLLLLLLLLFEAPASLLLLFAAAANSCVMSLRAVFACLVTVPSIQLL